ncbi:3-phosphoshikimate 1-carboxyvinyltransferase [Actinacidiphila alni]|uniref:3-phosphoshikimate 1-carboxyvinyltransferase n=1 Tax=Actinacidiphila alni TaxID=380248 RepID=A0A1I1XRB9_9ACTN|nr:3-phosphoshikimate 1-carboxyvinyltransferase [Actinacidiphila alni]SFE09148.1 3-phosphoshikimate 1-carboxyvinyltransferase [Actinacidiphila alni]
MNSSQTLYLRPGTPLTGAIRPPGAKSGTVRALLCGTLAAGTTRIENAGSGDNIRAMATACRLLGARIDEGDDRTWTVEGVDHRLPETAELDAGNSGIVLRLLTAVGAALPHCTVGTRNAASLGRRGNHEIIDTLRQFGARAVGRGDEACPPLVVGRGAGLRGGRVTVSGRRSSQFLSGLLFLAPLVGSDVEIEVVDGLSSVPMAMTSVTALARAGITVDVSDDHLLYRIAGGQRYRPAEFAVASDASSVAGLLAAAAAVPGSVTDVSGFAGDDLGTAAMIDALGTMGVRIDRRGSVLTCHGARTVRPIQLDGSACPDSILPMAALAAFADGTSVFSNVETLRFKECDRITDFCRELAAAGVAVEERRDAIIVHGRGAVAGGTEVFGHHDHSVIMAMATIALRSERGLTIRGCDAVGQTYRGFFDDLRTLGADVTEVPDAAGAADVPNTVAGTAGSPESDAREATMSDERYDERYADSLRRITEGIRAWNARCAAQDPAVLEVQPAPGVWSIKQNTWHLADAFEATTIRLRAMLTEDGPQLLRFDADEWAADRDYQGRPWYEAIAKLNEQLGRLMVTASGLDAAQLTRPGRQYNIAVNILGRPTEELSVLDLLEFEAAHVDEHTESTVKIIDEFGAPAVGAPTAGGPDGQR